MLDISFVLLLKFSLIVMFEIRFIFQDYSFLISVQQNFNNGAQSKISMYVAP